MIVESQRPITGAAGTTPSGPAAWKSLPSWAVVGTKDRVIPPETFLSVFNDRRSAPISIGVGRPFSSGGKYEHTA